MTKEVRWAELQDCLQAFTALWRQRRGQPAGYELISLQQSNEATRNMIDDPKTFLGTI
jgi:hypothetical protein